MHAQGVAVDADEDEDEEELLRQAITLSLDEGE